MVWSTRKWSVGGTACAVRVRAQIPVQVLGAQVGGKVRVRVRARPGASVCGRAKVPSTVVLHCTFLNGNPDSNPMLV